MIFGFDDNMYDAPKAVVNIPPYIIKRERLYNIGDDIDDIRDALICIDINLFNEPDKNLLILML